MGPEHGLGPHGEGGDGDQGEVAAVAFDAVEVLAVNALVAIRSEADSIALLLMSPLLLADPLPLIRSYFCCY